MTRFMTDAEREEIAAIEARCKARFQAAYDNLFVYRTSGIAAPSGVETGNTDSTEGKSPTGKAGDAQGPSA